jgi:hypothetical protein
MIVIPQSLQGRFTWVWSQDPALARPPASAEDKARKEFEQRLVIARETGRWQDVLRDGEQPTLFMVNPLPGSLLRRVSDQVGAGKLGVSQIWSVIVRLCLKGVANPDLELSLEVSPYGGEWVKEDVIELIDAFNPDVVTELGLYLFERAKAPPGK